MEVSFGFGMFPFYIPRMPEVLPMSDGFFPSCRPFVPKRETNDHKAIR